MDQQFKKVLKGLLIILLALTLAVSPTFAVVTAFANGDDNGEYEEYDEYEEVKDADDVEEAPPVSIPFDGNREFIIESPNGMIEDHRLVTANDFLELYLKDATLSIIIRDVNTGAIMHSTVAEPDPRNNIVWQNFTQSGIIIEYLTDANIHTTRVTMLEPGIQKNIDVTGNGFDAEVYFSYLGLGFGLSVELTETGIIAEVLYNSLVETGEYLLSGLYIFPFLGYTHLGGRDGYMFIPDGSGALIYLDHNNNRFRAPFSGKVFGENVGITLQNIPVTLRGRNVMQPAENILMPIFGMVHTDSQLGFLGIIEGGGEFNAVIEAYPNGAVTDYNWITTRFVYRQSFNQNMGHAGGSLQQVQGTRNQFDARIRFEFVTGEDASYSGLAIVYRNYLLKNDLVRPNEVDFRVRLDFLGLEQEAGMLFNRNVVMTTVDDIRDIKESLAESGVENILGIYRGWQNNGYNVGRLARRFRTASALGGNRALTRLLNDLEDTSMDLYLFNDPLRINASGASPLRFSAIRQINRTIFEEVVYQPVVEAFNFLQPTQVQSIFNGLRNSLQSNNVSNIMIGGITDNVFSHRIGTDLYIRNETANIFQEIISETDEQMNVLLEQPFAYLWSYTNAFINAPVRGSNYVFTTREVPFLAIVLRGIIPLYSQPVNFEANQTEFFLQLVEQGVRPTFYITKESPANLKHTNSSHIFTSEFATFENMVVQYYHELREIYELTTGATIECHQNINGLAVVEYSNGVIIYVNFTNQVRLFDGLRIEPLSYKVGGVQ